MPYLKHERQVRECNNAFAKPCSLKRDNALDLDEWIIKLSTTPLLL